jgi:prevent-host-death family protein
MKTVNIHEAKTHLSRLVEAAAAGEEIIIAKAGKPLVKLVALAAVQGPRSLGALAGKVTEAADCWAPDPALDAQFYGPDVEPGVGRRVAQRPPRK